VQFGGNFARLGLDALERAKAESHALRALFARYADCLIAQMLQATACNAIHSVEQRTAKWILAAIDRTGNKSVPLTQEQLSIMIGVGRSYVAHVLGTFREAGILRSRRGALEIIRPDLLKKRSCRCDEPVKSHFDTLLAGVYPK